MLAVKIGHLGIVVSWILAHKVGVSLCAGTITTSYRIHGDSNPPNLAWLAAALGYFELLNAGVIVPLAISDSISEVLFGSVPLWNSVCNSRCIVFVHLRRVSSLIIIEVRDLLNVIPEFPSVEVFPCWHIVGRLYFQLEYRSPIVGITSIWCHWIWDRNRLELESVFSHVRIRRSKLRLMPCQGVLDWEQTL